MDKRIGILHLSDIHASKKTQTTIQRLVELLVEDVIKLQKYYNVGIKIICISGDLISSGDNSDEELEILLDEFLQPIMDALNFDEKNVFIVAGNHEIKRNNIVNHNEIGLESVLTTEENIENFLLNIDSESLKRIEYFDKDFSTMFGGAAVLQTPLTRAYMVSMGELSVGISCINSAWRSTGRGSDEKRKMVIGCKQIIDSLEAIKSADIKICVMHHPLDWLVDDDKSAIEKCINQFDVVLNGHIHESDTKVYTSYNGQTLFNTSGKFDNSSDIYNGYSLIAINPFNKDCDVILRQYIDHPRNCYDEGINVAPNGMFSFPLGKKDDKLAMAYNVVHAIESKFLDYANGYFVSNVTAGKVLKSFDESFIMPELSRHSEYEKETKLDLGREDEEEIISLEAISKDRKNILLLGKKEIGKTTILHYMVKFYLSNFNALKTVPIILDALTIDYAGKNVIKRAIHKFLNEYCDESQSFSSSDVEVLLEAGLCAVMFDNFETVGQTELSKINAFLYEYPNNNFVFSEIENISARGLKNIEVTPSCEYETIHICSLSRHQIRAIATQNIISDDAASLVDKVMLCFKKTTLPKTPFVLSLILSLCDSSDFTPINEAVVMEQFMELLLEKSAPEEAYSTTFDFRIKEDFLIYIVMHMHNQNKFYLTNEEFEKLLFDYHTVKGFTVAETKFDILFIEKGVLIRTDLIVTFRYKCMIEYYLAKKAEESTDFLNYMLKDKNYINYSNELLYYTGLNRGKADILKVLQKDLYQEFDQLNDVLSELTNYNINIDIAIPEDRFSQKITESKLSQEQSDKLQNTRDTSEDNLPENMDKQVDAKDMDVFIQILLTYGSCLKNLELITKAEKEIAYKDYVFGLCVMLGILKRGTEEFYENKISDMENFPEEYTEEDTKKLRNLAQDIIRIALPLIVQNIALENVGTTKLRAIIEGVLNDEYSNEFEKFFSIFIFCDLRLSGLKNILGDYISNTEGKGLLTVIFFKLMYYYRFRYFSSSLDPFLENAMADINVKLNNGNKRNKSQIIKRLKSQKQLPSVEK